MKYKATLTSDERIYLLNLISSGKGSKEKLNRARILLKADQGEEGEHWTDEQISEAFYVSVVTVERTRKTLVEEGLEAVLERKPHKNRKKRIIQGEEEAYLIALACSNPPEGRCKWTVRLLAGKMIELEYVDTVSPETVRRALKKTS